MISVEKKSVIVKDLQKHEKDSGSEAVQVGILTARIAEITDHLKTNKKDHMARRGLLQMVGKRRRLLRYISDNNSQEYLDLIAKLGLRK